ncbi:septal ring lytic transglycosylase RlpA family protein [Thiorhodospira sibirica]|uniref:septal ring lytic transglycosylase RlpA family protein n=1 Tax=Thiorhodospira sibirica TaxID=154347 RepID=UPI00022C174F|nr:septal ring lytic transglycosylase RlpA family protein [Thiorhodospira sibirica]
MPYILGVIRVVAVIGLLVLLAACASKPMSPGDGPPKKVPDLSGVGDPTPRSEPLSRYGNPPTYEVFGQTYHTMNSAKGYVERGIASWYGTKFHGQRTSSGEPYDMYSMTAAHTRLPLPVYVRVTNLENGRSVIVRVNDRGPFVKNRLIDMSYAAAKRLGMLEKGTAVVEVRALDEGLPYLPDTQISAFPRELFRDPHAPAERDMYLQIGAFSSRSNAESLRQQLLANGLSGIGIHTASNHRGPPVYRVKVGPLASLDAAHQTVQKLDQLGVRDYRVIVD